MALNCFFGVVEPFARFEDESEDERDGEDEEDEDGNDSPLDTEAFTLEYYHKHQTYPHDPKQHRQKRYTSSGIRM